MKKLWHASSDVTHPLVESFTAGNDWNYDNYLLSFDCVASIAHADALSKIGVLTTAEHELLKGALQTVIKEHAEGRFSVTAEYEDCHTALEAKLTELCGEVGKKIHSGRSRNDQVFCALLLYGRNEFFEIIDATFTFALGCSARAEEEQNTPMMGRTHLQNAMPSTVGIWAGAYAEQIVMLGDLFGALYAITDRSPLGSAAGYGVPLPLDRAHTARLLGFSAPYQIVLTAANSRGHWEAHYLDLLGHIMIILSRFAADLLLFTLPEIGYMHLPENLCTGSSIMPHKRNPDILELMRAKAAAVSSASLPVKEIMRALPAGYNRDLQETKRFLIENINIVKETLAIAQLVIDNIEIDREALQKSMGPRIYSVDHALRLVEKEGLAFRDAYHAISTATDESAEEQKEEYAALIAARSSFGAPGNPQLPLLRARIARERETWQQKKSDIEKIMSARTARIKDTRVS